MAVYNYDVMVLGTGPADEGAAMNASKYGRRLAVVDSRRVVGDNCTHFGTIPFKTLRHSVKQIIKFNTNPMFHQIDEPRWFSFPSVPKNADRAISRQVASHTGYCAHNRIDMLADTANFVDERTAEVVTPGGAAERLVADQFVIVTGSRPYRPSDINFSHPRVYDSDAILSLSHTPRRLIVYGTGVIGYGYASVFSGLGVPVDLVNTRDQLFSFLDGEIPDALSYRLRNNNMLIRHNKECERVEELDNGVVLHLKSGEKTKTGALLWCSGQTDNTGELGLENVGIKVNSRGQIEVDENYRTSVSNIFTAGDVIGWPSLANVAYDQDHSAADNIVESDSRRFVNDVSTGIYTIPKINSIDRNESELTAAKIPYKMGEAFFKGMTRAQISSEPAGMLRILFHRETLEILGVHYFGDRVSEIAHTGQAIMGQPGELNTPKYFVNTTFNYPTTAEAYRVTTFDGLNRLF